MPRQVRKLFNHARMAEPVALVTLAALKHWGVLLGCIAMLHT